MLITVERIMSWDPCSKYPEERVRELIGEGKTPLEITNLDIPTQDIFWCLFRDEFFTNKELRLLACDFVEHVLPIWEEWAKTEDREYLIAHKTLVETIREYPEDQSKWDAARTTARTVDEAAARAAVWVIAEADVAATWAAVWAARAVAWAARVARAAVWTDVYFRDAYFRDGGAAESRWQLSIVRKKLEEKQNGEC